MFGSAQVWTTLSFSHSFGSSFCLGLLWSKLFSSVWFGLFWLVCSGLVPLVCTALVFSRRCPPGRFWPGLFFRVSPLVLDPIFSDMFCSALVWSTLSFSHSFGRSASIWAGLVGLCPVRFVSACFGLVCDALLHTCLFLQFCVGYSSSHLDWFGLIWSFLSALLVSSVVSVLVCPGWGQALRGWSGILYFCLVGRFGCGLVGLVWLCLCLIAGFSSLAWFDL